MDEKQIKQLKTKGKNMTKEWVIDGFYFILLLMFVNVMVCLMQVNSVGKTYGVVL